MGIGILLLFFPQISLFALATFPIICDNPVVRAGFALAQDTQTTVSFPKGPLRVVSLSEKRRTFPQKTAKNPTAWYNHIEYFHKI